MLSLSPLLSLINERLAQYRCFTVAVIRRAPCVHLCMCVYCCCVWFPVVEVWSRSLLMTWRCSRRSCCRPCSRARMRWMSYPARGTSKGRSLASRWLLTGTSPDNPTGSRAAWRRLGRTGATQATKCLLGVSFVIIGLKRVF